MGSRWNREIILMLAKGFMRDVEDGAQLPFTREDCPSLDVIHRSCYKKLQALQQEYAQASRLNTEDRTTRAEKKKQTARWDTRRTGVIIFSTTLMRCY